MLTLQDGRALPSGPLEVEHRTLEVGLRAWVERQTSERLGYVEQLYTFGDRDRIETDEARPARRDGRLSGAGARGAAAGDAEAGVAELVPLFPVGGLARRQAGGCWRRSTRGSALWASEAPAKPSGGCAQERLGLAFAACLERGAGARRYELLYEAGLIPERWRDLGRRRRLRRSGRRAADGADHRRILATAIGRLRGKIKYRPVVFELMPPAFTLLQLQRTVEALAGRTAAQAEFPPPRRAAGPGRGDRRAWGRNRRPAGPARPLPPRGPARTPVAGTRLPLARSA